MCKNDSYRVTGWWRQRKESKETVAKKIEAFLVELRKINSRFEDLYELGHAVSKPVGREIDSSYEGILNCMKEDKQFPDLGYWYWALGPDESITISINESCWSKPNNPANRIMIEFEPIVDESIFSFLKVENLIQILSAIVSVFVPVWGEVYTSNHLMKVNRGRGPIARWILYLSLPQNMIPTMPQGVEVLPMDDKGTIIITTPELFDAENQRHLDIASAITKRLDEAGILDELDCSKRCSSEKI